MTRCPSDVALEVHLLSPGTSRVRDHVVACPQCQARLADMRRLGDEFDRDVFPATVGALAGGPASPGEASRNRVIAAAGGPRRVPRWALVAAPLAAAAVLAMVLLRDLDHRGALDLTVLVEEAGRVQPVRDGDVVAATAALRFRVQPGSPCNLWVLSVQPSGDIIRLYPPKGDRDAEQRLAPVARQDLPTKAVLDGRAGPERIFAVCTKTPVPWNTVKTAAAEKLGKGEEAVRSYRSIPGLPKGATQSTLLVEKRS